MVPHASGFQLKSINMPGALLQLADTKDRLLNARHSSTSTRSEEGRRRACYSCDTGSELRLLILTGGREKKKGQDSKWREKRAEMHTWYVINGMEKKKEKKYQIQQYVLVRTAVELLHNYIDIYVPGTGTYHTV